MLPIALEVQRYASSHRGQLPAFASELSVAKWDELSVMLRELDLIEWARGKRPYSHGTAGAATRQKALQLRAEILAELGAKE